jgi:hypothetical protein
VWIIAAGLLATGAWLLTGSVLAKVVMMLAFALMVLWLVGVTSHHVRMLIEYRRSEKNLRARRFE